MLDTRLQAVQGSELCKGPSITSNPPKTISANSTRIRIVKVGHKTHPRFLLRSIRTFETDYNLDWLTFQMSNITMYFDFKIIV
jgi:hypothetical protein